MEYVPTFNPNKRICWRNVDKKQQPSANRQTGHLEGPFEIWIWYTALWYL